MSRPLINRINKHILYRKIANCLTIYRFIIGLPIIIYLSNGKILTAWILIVSGGITDFLDGIIARRSNIMSIWGSRFDPLADKFLILSPIIWLTQNNILPIWSVWLLIVREFLVSSWRSNQSTGAPASKGAKLKTFLQFSSILLMLWPIQFGGELVMIKLNIIGFWLFWPSLSLALISCIGYFSNQLTVRQR